MAETFIFRNRFKYRELARCKIDPIGFMNKELVNKLASAVQQVVNALVRIAVSFGRHSILRYKVREGVEVTTSGALQFRRRTS